MRVGTHLEARRARLRAYFREVRGEVGERRREAEIAALPQVVWKGRTLYTLQCQAETGRGPHLVNLPELWLWALIDLRRFRCPYHSHSL